jgi:hypothetical protein
MTKPEVLEVSGVSPERQAPELYASIRCPGCKGIGWIDRDQYEGKVSILCAECGWHETHDLRPANA